jgi:hypothetical protein
MTKIDRKDFLRGALAFAGAGIGLVGLASCANDNGSGTLAVETGGTSGTNVTDACDVTPPTDAIAANHGHVLTVTPADAAAGVDKTYDIMGTATHTHSVTITGPMFAALETGAGISTISTETNDHQHAITVICA